MYSLFVSWLFDYFRRGKKGRPVQQKMDGQLWCITRVGKRPQILKVEQLLALYLLLQCKRKWLKRNPRKLIWTSTDFRNEKPTSVVRRHSLTGLYSFLTTQWLRHMMEPRLCSRHSMKLFAIPVWVPFSLEVSVLVLGNIRSLPFFVFSLVRITNQDSFCLIAWTLSNEKFIHFLHARGVIKGLFSSQNFSYTTVISNVWPLIRSIKCG